MSQSLVRTVRRLGVTLALVALPATGAAVAVAHDAGSTATVVRASDGTTDEGATGAGTTDGTASGKDTTGWD
ncbi:hypothetical protein [Streptomyces fragilis]|uniref:Uncharacterized protein n=1 Tax=Streptomyces fragilis TaxID=67301 RepID=A0ABV2YGG2_9ACTN|nr:hypothetical protein [Streptomyces fragilis]